MSETGVGNLWDGIARAHGLENAMSGRAADLKRLFMGWQLGVYRRWDYHSGDFTDIREGDTIRRTGKIMEVPVGTA